MSALDEESRLVLEQVVALLESIGSANDAEDHGYAAEAERIRGEASEGVREIAREHPFVAELLPNLTEELDSGHVFGFGWSELAGAARAATRATCEICAQLADEEHGYQKFGWPEHDVDLPAAAGRLELVSDLGDGGSRERRLLACPTCGTRYLYTTDYEYLVNGTEDEQTLRRLAEGDPET